MSKTNIYVAGHNGMVGSSIVKLLRKKGEKNIITKSHSELDLTKLSEVTNFFKKKKINQIYLAAAKVGGIYANSNYPGEFIYENLMIEANVIHSAFLCGIKKILFLGSSCIYPKFINGSIKEEDLLSGKLEFTNEPYAIAKIAGIKMCESYNRQYGKSHSLDYRCVMPCNLYGPGDNYDLKNSHVIPAMIKKFYNAKKNNLSNVIIWGTGKPKREFLHVNDLAHACVYIMNTKKNKYYKSISPLSTHINVGSGEEITIKKLAELIKFITGYQGKIKFDRTKPDGTLSKLMNNNRIKKLGWKNKISLEKGLSEVCLDFKKSVEKKLI
jgi:GDP-L-fucose synthase